MKYKRCIHCKSFDNKAKDVAWKEQHPAYIGLCEKYGRAVNDSLCGCQDRGGRTILWNFSNQEATK
mgnify:CR=1 FL=1